MDLIQLVRACRTAAVGACLLLAAPGAAWAAYSGLYVFGDSLSDGGNGYLRNTLSPPGGQPGIGTSLGFLVPSNPLEAPYPANTTKFTNDNGQVAVERLASRLGLGLTPSASGGTNYAIGGATTGTLNFAGDGIRIEVPPGSGTLLPVYPSAIGQGIQTQVGQYLAGPGSGGASSSALYVLWGGPNDVFLSGTPGSGYAVDPLGWATNLGNSIGTLFGAGARDFLVPNMPNLGRIPAFNGGSPTPDPDLMTLTGFFNAALDGVLDAVRGQLPGANIFEYDTYALFEDAAANPGKYGFTDVLGRCFAPSGVVCSNPDEFLFWDGAHPTAAAHRLVGDAFFAAVVPEPQTYALLLSGLLVLVVMARRRVGGYPRA